MQKLKNLIMKGSLGRSVGSSKAPRDYLRMHSLKWHKERMVVNGTSSTVQYSNNLHKGIEKNG